MGRAFYRFGHEIALRVANGQVFALRDAELGSVFGSDTTPVCYLRGTFTATTYRGLIVRGLIPPNRDMVALSQPVTVRLNLNPEWAEKVAMDADGLHHIGRCLDSNSLTDEMARKLLMFDEWRLVAVAPLRPKAILVDAQPAPYDAEQASVLTEIVTSIASEVWMAAEEAGAAAQLPPPEAPLALTEAVMLFFEEEEWEVQPEKEGLLRTVFDGQNGSWMCYTQILPEFEQVLFYSVCPVSVPAIAIPTMIEFLSRVNGELSLGNFEIDFDFNVVRFRTSLDVTGVGLAPYLFRNIVFQNLAAMDTYMSDMLGIIAGRHDR